ncbi:MAG: serine/threonine protein kinase [Symploca sp. SIO3C6]|nr:serine/threonine protein kinase [Symploca sp. SIO3C6]NET03442.1 serine/threonine protein kinase [Symploca sp. SIO2B6]
MKTETNQLVLGKYLQGRYQIVKCLSSGAFGKTYVAKDTWQRSQPLCVVKHLKPNGTHPEQWEFGRLLFKSEAQTLEKLGSHELIPTLLDCFEDGQGFYLVQEFIAGDLLSNQMPTGKRSWRHWSEAQGTQLLQEVLGLLEFIHSQGLIHGDLKPNNLIRRSSDHRLVIIDFGVAHQIKPNQVKQSSSFSKRLKAPVLIRPLGYIPIEQLSGKPCFGSDLYALGMIAIEALTGLSPWQLKADPDTGEVCWQQYASVSEPMAVFLNHMVRYDFRNRFNSAASARELLQLLINTTEFPKGIKTTINHQASSRQNIGNSMNQSEEIASMSVSKAPITTAESQLCPSQASFSELALALWPKVPPLLAGMGVGMATVNGIALSFGVYSLLKVAPSNSGLEFLERAIEQYQLGNLNEAIRLIKSVPDDSDVYNESVSAREKWRHEWKQASAQFEIAQQAFNQQQWVDVLIAAGRTPNIDYWQRKLKPLVEKALPEVEAVSQRLLQQAYVKAAEKDFTGALALLRQISPETPTGAKITPKLAEYNHKQHIRAEYLLQQAYNLASERDFYRAQQYLSQIPQGTSTYETAQVKLVEYSRKQHYLEEVERKVNLAKAVVEPHLRFSDPFSKESFISNDGNNENPKLNPGNRWQEVSPKSKRVTPLL